MPGVAEAVVELLVAAGVRRAYTVPGESFLPLLDAFDRHPGLTLVSARHESGAAFMAEADAKLTGVPAVVLATRAVGRPTPRSASTPRTRTPRRWSCSWGRSSPAYLGREAFQEVDLPSFYGELTKLVGDRDLRRAGSPSWSPARCTSRPPGGPGRRWSRSRPTSSTGDVEATAGLAPADPAAGRPSIGAPPTRRRSRGC